NNFIIDMQQCSKTDNTSFPALAELHEDCYMNQRSLVFTGIQAPVLDALNENELAEMLNIAPTMQEAVDIISMEILERDLMNED
ncbi:MAG: STAS domain-containing protein, partial [Bacteroidetes bacterium]|nr:STAS domain-containing protein [Bacteroidota bacterium]